MERVDAWVGLGSNLDGPAARVRWALEALGSLPRTQRVASSRLYGSAPMGPPGQPDYVNAVAWLTTALGPHALLDELQRIENEAGRVRTGERWGPRTLDLDLLLYGNRVIRDARLSVPHPGLAERAFVLVPLAEIAPDLDVPGQGRIDSLLDALGERELWPVAADAE